MKIHLIAVGTRMPEWVKRGYADYAERLPRECALQLIEIPVAKRGAHTTDVSRLIRAEGERSLAAAPHDSVRIALDERGTLWSTAVLAEQLARWQHSGRAVSLFIGGPDGLDPQCRDRADQLWSLSPLTLPHALVRVIVAEQLYRAWSLLNHHPYHRA